MKLSSSMVVLFYFFLTTYPVVGQFSQQPLAVDREEYFRRIEQRAISLSKKMAEISGNEAVQIITPLEEPETVVPSPSTLSAQQFYDALPGPESKESNSSLRPVPSRIEMNSTVPETSEEEYFVEMRPTSEELKGAFFIRPFLGLQAPSDLRVKIGVSQEKVESSKGYGLGLKGGKRIENLLLSFQLGYFYNEIYKNNLLGVPGFDLEGENELFSFLASLGYSVPVSDSFTFEVSGGLGLANRSSAFWTYFVTPPNLENFSSMVFSYELSMHLDYSYSELLSVFLGYRFIGASENDAFDSMTAHFFELGIGANF